MRLEINHALSKVGDLQLRIISIFSIALLALLLTSPGVARASNDKRTYSDVTVYRSVALPTKVVGLQLQTQVHFQPESANDPSLATFEVDPVKVSQVMEGFGGALTESCAMNLDRLPAATRHEALEKLFSKTAGAGFDVIRLPMGASDFADSSLGSYTYDDSPGNVADPNFTHFKMDRDEKTFTIIREALTINPAIRVLITPWSPPAWMKVPQDLKGGTLSPDHYQDLANYFSKVIREYRARSVPVEMLTIQNEPGYATTDYPSMTLSVGEQIKFIAEFLGPQLDRDNVHVRIYAHDHNNSTVSEVNEILDDPGAAKYVGGVGYHCYTGDRSQMDESMGKHPSTPTLQTECTAWGAGDPQKDFNWWLENHSIGAVNQGTTGSVAWNFCLDEKDGPKNGGCPNCHGLITTDFSKTTPELQFNTEYYALAQVSRFIVPGAQRIAINVSKPKFRGLASPPQPPSAADLIESTAYRNPAGDFVFVAHNPSKTGLRFKIRQAGLGFAYDLPAMSAVTFTWR